MSKRLLASFEIVIAVLFLLTLLTMIAPLVTGVVIRHQFEEIMRLEKVAGFKIEASTYKQGWFQSKQRVTLNQLDSEFSIQIVNTIIHGPLYFGILDHGRWPFVKAFVDSEITFRPSSSSKSFSLFSLQSPIQFNNYIDGYIKNLNNQASAMPDQDSVLQKYLSGGEFHYSPDDSGFTVNLAFNELGIFYEGNSYLAEQLNITADYTLDLYSDNFPGKLIITANTIEIIKSQNDIAETVQDMIKEFSFQIISAINNEDTHYRITTGLSDASIGELNLTKLDLEAAYSNMDCLFPIQIIKTLISSSANWSADLYEVLYLLPKCLGKGQFELSRLHAETTKGDFEVWFRVSMPEYQESGGMDPVFLLMALKLNSEISISKTLLDTIYAAKAPAMFYKENPQLAQILNAEEFNVRALALARDKLASLVQQKYLEDIGDRYETSLYIQQGDFKINKQAINPMQVLFFQNTDADSAVPVK